MDTKFQFKIQKILSASSHTYFRQKGLNIFLCRLIDKYAVDRVQLVRRVNKEIKNSTERLRISAKIEDDIVYLYLTRFDGSNIFQIHPSFIFSQQIRKILSYPYREIIQRAINELNYLREHVYTPISDGDKVCQGYMLREELELLVGKFSCDLLRSRNDIYDLARRIYHQSKAIKILSRNVDERIELKLLSFG